jgi:hypothetical protein
MTKTIARVDEVWLGIEDHGVFTVHIGWDYGGTHQGTGHLCLDEWDRDTEKRTSGPEGITFLRRLCEVFGVSEFTKIKGRTIYVLRDSDEWGSRPLGFEQLPFNGGKTFLFSEVFPRDEAARSAA